ncbi:MAG: PHP domain protein [Parcubacteria group bacterium GW2011_GWA2_42_35]|nr:MAG: PHP domain protein [Parcubacteria group bacterium GW2011_GWA2_42_35]
MTNQELAKIFFEMAELLEMEEVEFKPRAYEKAGHSLEVLEEDINLFYKKGGIKALESIPAVGRGIAERIEEYLKTGKIKDYEKLKKKTPINIFELSAIEGVGPKIIKVLYKKLGIKNIKDLEKSAKAGKLRNLPRFGEKLEQKILKSIKF